MSFETWLFVLFCVAVLVIGGLFQLYLLIYHPAAWAQMNQQAHERRMAWKASQEAAAARKHERAQVGLGVFGLLLRLFIGGR